MIYFISMTIKLLKISMARIRKVIIMRTNLLSLLSKEYQNNQLRLSFGTVIQFLILELIVMYTLILGNLKFGF